MRARRVVAGAAALGALVLLVGGAASAAAAPVLDGQFDVADTPGELVLGGDGNMWVALSGGANDVARITPAGQVTAFDLPGVDGPTGMARGPGGRVWFSRAGGYSHFDPADPGAVTPLNILGFGDPRGIARGPDGNMWGASDDRVYRITPAGGITTFTVAGMGARGVAAGTDGRIYVADFAGQRIISLTTAGDDPVETLSGGGPQRVVGELPGQLAYTDAGTDPHHIGRFSPDRDPLKTAVPGSDPFGIAVGADRAYWVAQFASHGVARLTPEGVLTQLPGVPAGSGPREIARGPGNTMWVSLESANKVARISGVDPPPPPPDPAPGPLPVGPAPLVPSAPPGITRPRAPRSVAFGRPIAVTTRLTRDATLLVRVHRILPGRRAARGRCVAPRPALRRVRVCARYRLVGAFGRPRTAGTARVAVGPRIGRGRLVPGRYRIGIRARTTGGQVSPWLSTVVTVRPAPRIAR
jgi:virginiamycin B lyase